MPLFAQVAILFVFAQISSQVTSYHASLTYTVCTPAHCWPNDEKEYLSWLDRQLLFAPSAKYAGILATKGYYQHCKLNPEGRRNLAAALALAPSDPRIICFCILAGKIETTESIAKVLQDEAWETNLFVSRLLSHGDLNTINELQIPKTDEPVVKLIHALQLHFKDDHAQAERIVKSYLKEHKTGPLQMPEMPHLFLAYILRNDGRLKEAKAVLSEGLSLNPFSNSGLLEMVELDCALGERGQALTIAMAMNDAFPETSHANRAMAHAFYYNREFKKAVPYYERIVPECKDDAETTGSAADCFVKARMPQRAVALLQDFVRGSPDHPASEEFKFRAAVYQLLNTTYSGGDKSELIDLVENGVKSGYGSRFDRLLGVGAMANQGKFETGKELLRLVDTEKLDASFDTLKLALHAALDSKQAFYY